MKTNLSVQKSFSLIFLFMTAIILVLTYLLVKSNQELKLEKCSYKCEKQTHVINGNRNIGFGNTSIRIKVVHSSTCNSPKNAGTGYIAESRGATEYDTLVINYTKALQGLNKRHLHAGVQACTVHSKADIDSAIRICAKLGALPTTTALGIEAGRQINKIYGHDINLFNQIRLINIKCSDKDWKDVREKINHAIDSVKHRPIFCYVGRDVTKGRTYFYKAGLFSTQKYLWE